MGILAGGCSLLIVEHVARFAFPAGEPVIAASEGLQNLARRQRRLLGLERGEIAARRGNRAATRPDEKEQKQRRGAADQMAGEFHGLV